MVLEKEAVWKKRREVFEKLTAQMEEHGLDVHLLIELIDLVETYEQLLCQEQTDAMQVSEMKKLHNLSYIVSNCNAEEIEEMYNAFLKQEQEKKSLYR